MKRLVSLLSMALTPQQQGCICDLPLNQQTAQPNRGSSLRAIRAVEAAVKPAVATALSAWQRVCRHASLVLGVALGPGLSHRGKVSRSFHVCISEIQGVLRGVWCVDLARAQLNNVA